ncbi:glycoside hydrolase family 61 protein [Ceratobasidium sp. AG-Ba]|nr:glycoside hydrolase family 61 protein [Ceratobasidium sp. AG-Ba]
MKSVFVLVALAAAAVQPALAHYRFPMFVDSTGAVSAEYTYNRRNTNSNSPVTDIKSTDFRCNVGGLNGVSQISTVPAGSTVGFKSDTSVTHPGPLQVYLGKVPSGQTAATWDGSGANWFKIYAIGADFSSGTLAWPTDNQSTFKFKIPANTPSGQYLLRIEHIALHAASTVGGAQFYISCAQINVTGGGSGNPAKVSIPGVYTGTEPGLLLSIYWPPVTSYTPPGPAVWSG